MGVMVECLCGCGRSKEVREADQKRGWGKYYSKSCKAKAQSKKHGGRPKAKLTKQQRWQCLCQAVEDGRISDEYFLLVARDEYPEFMDSDMEVDAYHELDVHPFSSEGLGQD